jgi:acetyl-CoA carboxylase biotin carboxylase subunit
VGLHYDPMLAKLIVHAPTRPLAIARMQRALRELVIDGVETSRGFHLRLLEHPDVQSGDLTIQWLEAHLDELTNAPAAPETIQLAAIAAALASEQDRSVRSSSPSAATDGGTTASAPLAHSDAWRAVARREALRRD